MMCPNQHVLIDGAIDELLSNFCHFRQYFPYSGCFQNTNEGKIVNRLSDEAKEGEMVSSFKAYSIT